MTQYLVAIHHPDDYDPSVETEAMDREEHFFTERRLKEVLRQSGGLTPKDLAARVLGAVGEFTAGAEQSDDITGMGVRWQ